MAVSVITIAAAQISQTWERILCKTETTRKNIKIDFRPSERQLLTMEIASTGFIAPKGGDLFNII